MSEVSITCLGVGDGWPDADRNHASFLYRFGKTTLLLDAGEPVSRGLKAAGVDFQSLNGVILSHLHADHVGGFLMLVQSLWLERRRKALPVFLPRGGVAPIRSMLRASLLFPQLLPFELHWRPLIRRKVSTLDGVRIAAHPTTHLTSLKSRFSRVRGVDFSAYCFLLEAGGKRVGHSADLGRVEDLEPLVKRPLDWLVCELSHLDSGALWSYLRGKEIGGLLLVHLSAAQWREKSRLERTARRELPGVRVVVAADGQSIQF